MAGKGERCGNADLRERVGTLLCFSFFFDVKPIATLSEMTILFPRRGNEFTKMQIMRGPRRKGAAVLSMYTCIRA